MSEAAVNQPPASKDAILKAIETERRKLAQWFASRVREIEAERDGRLAGLDRAGRALDSEPTAAIKAEKRSRSKKAKSAAALAGEKRDAIVRLLGERAEPLALGEIHRALKISEFSARSALKRLVCEGKIRRLGTGAATRYEASPSRPTGGASPADGRSGTMEGRLLAVVQDRASASLDELVQAAGAPPEKVRRACGALIAEGEIRMGRRDGRPVYVVRRAA
jgi:hypothetical protein